MHQNTSKDKHTKEKKENNQNCLIDYYTWDWRLFGIVIYWFMILWLMYHFKGK